MRRESAWLSELGKTSWLYFALSVILTPAFLSNISEAPSVAILASDLAEIKHDSKLSTMLSAEREDSSSKSKNTVTGPT